VKSFQRNDRDFNHLDMSGVPDKQQIHIAYGHKYSLWSAA